MKPISLAIVGVDYPNKRGPARRFELALCRPGDPVELRPEPTNPADPNAIAIYSERSVQLGYVTAERAPLVLARIKAGHDVRGAFQGLSMHCPWVRVTFDGADPVLSIPPALPVACARASDDDFWPDPVYDEE